MNSEMQHIQEVGHHVSTTTKTVESCGHGNEHNQKKRRENETYGQNLHKSHSRLYIVRTSEQKSRYYLI